ncbi:S41 family peptidase [Pelotomaculum propionicicum]|uniref:S41 family peptidase n=1 Tax=Pelotomaculum propionicicum TaxID=258475 RepID=UPI003B785C54
MSYNKFESSAADRRLKFLAIFIIAVFVIMGALVATNYKHISNLVKVVAIVRTQYLQPVNSAQMIDGAIKGIVNSLNDPYSVYLEPKTFAMLQEQIKGSFGGLGILVGVKDQNLTVVRAYQGTPAARAGIEAGDVIVKINESDARGIDLETAINLMRGPVGSTINLTVERQGSTLQFTNIAREEISVPTVEGRVIVNSDIGYVIISQFTERTPEELKAVLANLQGSKIKGLILDLRDNPGGELTSAVNVAKNFIPKGPIVYIDYRTGRDQEFPSEGLTVGLPLVVLINGGSASAAEILAGAVKDTGAGTLVGTKTFGKGVVQTLFQLDNGAGLKITTARYLTPNKNDINLKGIEPDVTVQAQEPPHDPQMDRAVEIMKQKIAG